jgi:amidohydrolase
MREQAIADLLGNIPDLTRYETLYKHFHSHPELSLQEKETASAIASHLKSLNAGYELHTSIGGHGLAGVLENGSGPTVLLRADMDALPVLELTGLPYASKVTMKDVADDTEKPVMHACGHDMHITCLLAAAEHLAGIKSAWTGTLIVLFQPNEERAGGAKAMVDDDLYSKIPIPDVVLGQHVMPLRSGRVGNRPGTIMGAADSFKVKLYGKGSHGSMPHRSIDPVVLAANVVLRLQNIVSREIDPAEMAVVTVGSVQAGSTENIIADHAVLKVNTRTTTPAVRERVLAALRRIVEAECEASNSPKAPLIEPTSRFPLTINDEDIASQLSSSFSKFFKEDFDPSTRLINGSEDVSILATSIDRPYNFWFFGGVDQELWDRAEKEGRLFEDVPANHSAYFAPVIQPTLRAGVEALCVGALTFLEQQY